MATNDDRLQNRPNTAINLQAVMEYADDFYSQENLAKALCCDKAQITRYLRYGSLPANRREKIAQVYHFRSYKLSDLTLELEPSRFWRELVRVGFGKLATINRVAAFLDAIPVSHGYFIDEGLLSRLAALRAHRGMGADDVFDGFPVSLGLIGSRYGIALEVDVPMVASAVRSGDAYVVLLHAERVSQTLTVEEWGGGEVIASLDARFFWPIPFDVTAESFSVIPTAMALLAPREASDGKPRFGYAIKGATGRRDIYAFLFAGLPSLGEPWKGAKAGHTVDPAMVDALMLAIKEQEGDDCNPVRVKIAHIVYDAIPAQ